MGRYVFKLPDVGEGTAEAELVAWHVAVGDRVVEDQPLADVMTDKATVELTSPVTGVVRELKGEPGEMRAVKSELVILETDGELAAEPEAETMVPAPSGERNVDPRDPPPTTPATERPAAVTAEGDFLFRQPDVGEGTAEAELVAWHVAIGDTVAEDQPLADVMTDKATVELTSPVAGVVVALHGAPGQMIAVKAPLVELATGAAPAASAPASPSSLSASADGEAAEGGQAGASAAPTAPSAPASRPAKALAAPAVRRRAQELGVDLAAVTGTGPDGRVTHADLDAQLARAPSGAAPSALYARREGADELKVIGLRRKIAAQMQEAKRRIPHFAYIEACDVTELEDLRAHLNAEKRADQPKLTLLPFLIRALVKALPGFPNINARFDDEAGVLHRHAAVHLGMATQTAGGLVVPVIRHAEAMDVWALAAEITRLAQATRDGTARKEELSGSTITLTSLGALGGVAHTPVVNHPETAIVGPNKIVETPVVRHGQIVVRKMMNLSSSFDHRVVDGYDAAAFIQQVKGLLERPATLFM